MTEPTKFTLTEDRIPTHWVNLMPDLPGEPLPPLNPGTMQPAGPDDLTPIFPMELIGQEVSADSEVEIPEPVRAIQRRRAPQAVGVADRVGDRDLRLHRDLLADQPHREDRRQIIGPGRLHRARIEGRKRIPGQVGKEVDPVRGDPALVQQVLDGVVAHALSQGASRLRAHAT